jgi:hypothetical protein
LVLYNTKAKGCTTDKGPWYVSAIKGLAMEWLHETFWEEECGREVVFLHQAQNKEVLPDAKYKRVSFIVFIRLPKKTSSGEVVKESV